jgi:hypothetical protein
MPIIHKSGYLKRNPRFPMAKIVFSNNNESQVLATKRQALEIGEAMRDAGNITPEEWLVIRQQIHESDLPDKDRVIEDMTNQLQGDLEELRRQIEKFNRLQKHRDDEGDGWKKS